MRVSCVNYRRAPAEEGTFIKPHFRILDPHWAGCVGAEVPSPSDGTTAGGASSQVRGPKLDNWFDRFDPHDRDVNNVLPGANGQPPMGDEPDGAGEGMGSRGDGQAMPTRSQTRFIEDLVEMRLESIETLGRPAADALEVQVKGQGIITLGQLFCHVKEGHRWDVPLVLYGGCTLIKRYATGFKLRFFDKIGASPVQLYVSHADLTAYRFRRSLLDVVDAAEDFRYLTAYMWSTVVKSPESDAFEVTLGRLQHLALYPGPSQVAK